MLDSDHLTHVGLKQQVAGLNQPIVQSVVVSLVQCRPDPHPRMPVLVDLTHKLSNLLL